MPLPLLVFNGLLQPVALPVALVYLHGAGTTPYQDRPGIFLALLRTFLSGRPLPVAPVLWITARWTTRGRHDHR
jgi:hypothetical protein